MSSQLTVKTLSHEGMDCATAYAYLSAATDFQVSQVVDGTKGGHGMIRKSDFERVLDKKK